MQNNSQQEIQEKVKKIKEPKVLKEKKPKKEKTEKEKIADRWVKLLHSQHLFIKECCDLRLEAPIFILELKAKVKFLNSISPLLTTNSFAWGISLIS